MGAEGTPPSSRVCPCLGAFAPCCTQQTCRNDQKGVMSTGVTRTITIATDRLLPWVTGFRSRHGETSAALVGDSVQLTGTDGAEAAIAVPFAPLSRTADDVVADLRRHLAEPRRVGAVLVRKGGFAVGVFEGSRLTVSKVGSSYVQGRTKAGGWSQQRYARRRDHQAKRAYGQAADEAARILLPELDSLVAVVSGGDQAGLAAVFADPRLSELRALLLPEVHSVPDPRLRVLQAFPEQFLTLRIELNDVA